MEFLVFILSIIFIYAIDLYFFMWLSYRFAGLGQISHGRILSGSIAILIFTVLIFSALLQVPLEIKPFILFIAFAAIVGVFIYNFQEQPVKATVAGVFFIFCQLIFTIFLLKYFWYNRFVQTIKFIFLESLY